VHASCLKARVKQLDFVGAFLQAKMRTRMFVTIPKIFGLLFPEYALCTGKPVHLYVHVWYDPVREVLVPGPPRLPKRDKI
jgi:hypothetical protein